MTETALKAPASSDRFAKLFALHRQVEDEVESAPRPKPRKAHLTPVQEATLRQIAIQSLTDRPAAIRATLSDRLRQSLSRLKPVATTNFSDESDLLAGGLTFTTLSNLRLSNA